MKRSDIEITAPAGSWELLMAAVQAGADSVYFGAGKLNMRSKSSLNFESGDLGKITSICRENGMKSYITLNAVIYDSEREEMKRMIDAAINSGVDGVIASDMSVIEYSFRKGFPVHLSTQLNISNTDTLRFFAAYGDVAVLARELDLEKVKRIYDAIRKENICGPGGEQIRIEMFVHGALCMAVSGKCYMSLHENNTSANRGSCYQTCRRSYIVTDRESGYELAIDNEYIMSPRDLCTIGFIDRMMDAGVRILKIEGRARSPEYVRTVTECYDEAVRAVIDGSYCSEKIKDWEKRLATVFNRGFWDGYYLGRKTGEWHNRYGSAATRRKVYLGRITNYFARPGVAEIKLENGDLSSGDTLLITGPTTGVVEYTAGEIRVDYKETARAARGTYCSVKINEFLRTSDKVYKWVDESEIIPQGNHSQNI
ncbi:MAG: U32 family peptidase [Bacteroidales bacterium]|nr:U32 family peptidase [Bacteroidales bacterium]